MNDRMTWREAAKLALAYATAGIPAGPIAIGWDEAKQGTSKRPLTRHGHEDFSTDPEAVARAFAQARHRLRDGDVMGVGLWPGPAGYVVLDVDVKNPEKDGSVTLAKLEAENGALPDHPVVVTASGGRHEWLRKTGYLGNTGLGEGIDIRSDKGWVVAPGVVAPWGTWGTEGAALDLSAVPEAPEWVTARLSTTRPAEREQGAGWSELDRTALHPANLKALEALEALGGHSPFISDGTLRIVRPGKTSGISASIGFEGSDKPGLVKVFTSEWPGLKQDATYDADQLAEKVELNAMAETGVNPSEPQRGGEGIDAELDVLGVTDLLVRRHARDEWARGEARRLVRRLGNPPADPPGGSSLTALLAEPDEETPWRVHGLIPVGANVLVVAQAKSGKTTLVNNLIKSLVDWEVFLTEDVEGTGDLGKVAPLMEGERVMVLDLELDRRTIRRWLRDQRITNTGSVMVESLRGRIDVFDIQDLERRAAWAKHLAEHNVKVLVVDCLSPLLAHYGAEENSNTEVGRIIAALEALKHDADVEELILVHHAGHNAERSRGASRLRGWPDVEVLLTIEGSEKPGVEPPPDAPRYIAARGRDVAMRERKLVFNSATRRLSLAPEGGTRAQAELGKVRKSLLDQIEKRPGSSQRQLCGTNNKLKDVLQTLIDEGLVHTGPGPRNSLLHAMADDCGTPTNCPRTKVAT